MLSSVQHLTYVIILCEDMERMKAFYRDLFTFEVDSESPTSLALRAGSVLLGLRQRTRGYDGSGVRKELPGVQIAFLVEREEVDSCYEQLVAKGVEILEPPTDQPRGHRTVYFADPEGNMLEIYAEIEPFTV
jgi:catechol 2,3-dioxygenase-like lactoylglutathione lyase family enzyme